MTAAREQNQNEGPECARVYDHPAISRALAASVKKAEKQGRIYTKPACDRREWRFFAAGAFSFQRCGGNQRSRYSLSLLRYSRCENTRAASASQLALAATRM